METTGFRANIENLRILFGKKKWNPIHPSQDR